MRLLLNKPVYRFSFAILLAVLVSLSAPLLSISAGLSDTSYAFAEEGDPGEGGEDPGGGGSDPGGGSNDPGGGSNDPGGGSNDPGGGSNDPGGGSNDPDDPDPPPTTYKVRGVSIYYKDGGDPLSGASSNGGEYIGDIQIDTKGQTVTFDSLIAWESALNADPTRNANFVTWSTNDPSVATISPGGVVTPLKDGTVQISATVPGSHSDTGADIVAKLNIQISGQGDGRYITNIRVVDETGRQITVNNFYLLEEDLSTAMVQFHAEVDVYDPVTKQTVTLSTKGSNGAYVKISDQAPDLSDVYWSTGDGAMAAIERDWGLFRPVRYGVSFFYVTTRATLGNREISADAAVSTLDPSGIGAESYNPQSSIRVKAYYQLYKPKDLGGTQENDVAYFIDETYSLAEVSQMGLFTETYTALGNGSYMTMTGTGVGLGTFLREAGVNLSGVNGLMFYAADGHMAGQLISYSHLFAARYYYPNIYTGFAPYSNAKQVQPMLAIVSNQISNGRTEPNLTMSEATRFRLLLGAMPGSNDTQYTIKWINTIVVEMSGGPGTGFGDGSGTGDGTGTGDGDGDGDGNGSGTGEEDGDGTGTGGQDGNTGEGAGGTPVGSDSGGNEGSNKTLTSDLEIGTGSINDIETTIGIDTEDVPLTAGSKESSSAKRYNIYQVMNINDSEVPLALPDNPFKAFAFPAVIIVLAIGVLSMFFWYRRESGMIFYDPGGISVSKLV